MKWPWQAAPGSPGTADTQVPLPYEPKVIKTKNDGFKDHIKWTTASESGRIYARVTCLVCEVKFGTCRNLERLEELKQQHREKCWWPCGFPDCIDCNTEPPTVVVYNAA